MKRETVERIDEVFSNFQSMISEILRGEEIEEEINVMCEETNCRVEVTHLGQSPHIEEINNISPYEINIRQVNNGIIVQIGCQTFVFEDIEKFSKMMIEYYKNPSNTIDSFYNGELFK